MAVSPIRYQDSGRSPNPETLIDTGFNSLANGSGATSAAVANTEKDTMVDLELVLASLTPTVALFELFAVRSVDATNYEDVPPLGGFVGSVYPTTSTGAKRCILGGVAVPPITHKWHGINRTGVALGSSGNTLKGFFYRMGVGT